MTRRPIVIRRATATDAKAVSPIYVESWASGFGDLMPPRTLEGCADRPLGCRVESARPSQWWVAEIGGVLVGCVRITTSRDPIDEGLGELDTIAVDPAHWRVGVGGALMGIAIDGLAREGYRRAIR